MKGKCYHAVLVWYGPACPKLSEITDHKYLQRVDCKYLCMYLFVSC